MKIYTFEFNYFGVNTYVVWDEKSSETAIIDPGMHKLQEEEILNTFILEHRLKVVRLINTHLHIDHMMGNDFVEDIYHVGLTAHYSDSFLGEGRDMQANMFHLKNVKTTPITIKHPVKQGDKIHLGDEWLEVIEVPGHSPGSIALYCPQSSFVITGDALFNGSIGRTDLPGGNYSILIQSIKNQLLSLPPKTTVYPGHGPKTTIGNELLDNPFFK